MDADGRSAYGAGVEHYEQGDYREAIRELLNSADLREHFKTCERLFDAYSAIGDEARADVWIGRAFALNPANAQVACKFSEVLIREQRLAEAAQILQKLLARHPSYGPARRLLRTIENGNEAAGPEGEEPI
ncbi:hypothetical protein [Saccharibacillus sp. O23]|uniref:hypothetical protein n=1 Tax=Saccharibacillus sp. O23 TaxID=2009338 RepID=UPI0015C61206|nr:hypothetical protein [Saccharibacillus sp. O23]